MKVLPVDTAIQYAHLSVPGTHIRIGRGDVHAFFYADTLQPREDLARLDSSTGAPPGVEMRWPAHMTLVRSLNLVAILLIDSPGHTERVANGILGGLPPPER
jgi:hypothetical protein